MVSGKNTWRWVTAVAVLVLASVLVACGSGGETETTTSTISKREFMTKAKAICRQASREIDKVYSTYVNPPWPDGHHPTQEEMNQVAVEVVIPAREKQIRRIRALGAPPGEGRQIEEILEAIEEGIEKGEKDRRTIRGFKTDYAFARSVKLEIAYGLEECFT